MSAKLFDDNALTRAYLALADGDSAISRRFLASVDTAFAQEIDGLIRAGLHDDAVQRLRVYLNPKFKTAEECAQHVGEPFHFVNS
jgi:hypothetical protein